MTHQPLRVGIVAGEASGDILGAGLIRALKSLHPDVTFVGIGGPSMIAEGCESLEPMETLSVMGLVEVIRHIRPLLRVRRHLIQTFLDNPPDVFIGIDAPDFCLPVAKRLKEQGIKTVQYVSPSVWAWRQKRIHRIKKSVDSVLCIFPFEKAFYDRHDMHATFVGHTLADQLPFEPDVLAARQTLNIDSGATWVALMPGSRLSEIRRMLGLLLDTATGLSAQRPSVKFIIPVVNQNCETLIQEQLLSYPDLSVTLIQGNSHHVMTAADAIVMTSGTATLEAMLLKKPMVVTYRMAALSWWLVKRLVHIEWASLPNLLAQKSLVPEFLQEQATVENLLPALSACLDEGYRGDQIREFQTIHDMLRCGADRRAAEAVLECIS